MTNIKSSLFPILLNSIVTFGRFFSLPFLTLMLAKRGMALSNIGVIIGTPAFISIFFSPISSFIISEYSTKLVLSVSFLLMSIGFWGYGTFYSFFSLLFFAILVGIGLAIYNPIVLAMISSCSGDVDKSMSTNYWMINLAGAVGPLVGSYFGGGENQFPFIMYSGLLLVLQLPIVFNSYKLNTIKKETPSIFVKKYLVKMFMNIRFISICLVYLLLFVIETQYDSAFGIRIKQMTSMGSQYLAYMLLTMTITVLILQPLIIFWGQRFSDHLHIGLGWLLYMLGIITVGFANVGNVFYILLIGFLFGAGESLIGPKVQTFVGNSVNPNERTIAFSLSTAFGNVGYFLGPVFGLSFLSSGFQMYMIFLSVIGLFIGIFLFIFLSKGEELS